MGVATVHRDGFQRFPYGFQAFSGGSGIWHGILLMNIHLPVLKPCAGALDDFPDFRHPSHGDVPQFPQFSSMTYPSRGDFFLVSSRIERQRENTQIETRKVVDSFFFAANCWNGPSLTCAGLQDHCVRFGDARLKDLLHAAPQHVRICSVRFRDRVARGGGLITPTP